MNKNIKEIIEPEFKHQAIASVEVRKQVNNRVLANVMVPASFEQTPINRTASTVNQQQKPQQAVGPIEETGTNKINKAKAVYGKCVQILNKMGGFSEEQSDQLCRLLTETLIIAEEEQSEEQQQPNNNSPGNNPAGNSTDTRPPPSGFVGSSSNATDCARRAALNKELEIKKEQVQQLSIEVAKEREAHHQRVARIASLENTLHILKLDKYLSDYIVDEPVRDWQVRKMASKGMTVEDLREIYEGIPPKPKMQTASVKRPKSKVRLRTASTDEYNNSSDRQSRIQNTNERLANSYLGNNSNNLYDDIA